MTLDLPKKLADLVSAEILPPLGPGRLDATIRARLTSLAATDLFNAGTKIRDREAAQACLSGLWLLHDGLDESHRISQDLETVEGSYWHAIMHRREPDAWNSKYWWRRVGDHPTFSTIAEAAVKAWREAKEPPDFANLMTKKRWDPSAFVDVVESVRGTISPAERLAQTIQRIEWDALFVYCWRKAIDE